MAVARVDQNIQQLVNARLLDIERGAMEDGDIIRPHNWAKRQFEESSSTERTRRYRDKLNQKSDDTVTEGERVTERHGDASHRGHSRARSESVSVLEVSVSEDSNKNFLTNERFEQFWNIWAKVRGTARKNQAFQAWISVVTVALHQDAIQCTQSYLGGLDNPAKGFNPDNFLFEQARQGFTARWPVYASRSVIPRKETGAERVVALMKKRISEGRSPM